MNEEKDISIIFQNGSGMTNSYTASILIGLALVIFTIWAILGITKTLSDKSDNAEKIKTLIYLAGLFMVWVAFVSLFF